MNRSAFNPGTAFQIVQDRVRASAAYQQLLTVARNHAAAEWAKCPTVELARAAGGRTAVTLRAIEHAIATVGAVAQQELGSKMFPATPASVLRQDADRVRTATQEPMAPPTLAQIQARFRQTYPLARLILPQRHGVGIGFCVTVTTPLMGTDMTYTFTSLDGNHFYCSAPQGAEPDLYLTERP